MDSLRLLIRSTNLKVGSNQKPAQSHHLPSEGTPSNPQLFHEPPNQGSTPKKRKRDDTGNEETEGLPNPGSLNFFNKGAQGANSHVTPSTKPQTQDQEEVAEGYDPASIPLEERKKVLKSHKIKVTNLSSLAEPPVQPTKKSKKAKANPVPNRKKQKEASRLYPSPITSFKQLQPAYDVSTTLSRNLDEQGYYVPTEVQLASLPLLLGGIEESSSTPSTTGDAIDLLTVAPTGSGKTLAFLIPLIHRLHQNRGSERRVTALILAPTKELVNQIVNEGRRLCNKTGIHITAMRKGMVFDSNDSQEVELESDDDEQSDDGEDNKNTKASLVKSDIVISTPLLLANTISQKTLPHIKYLIMDEADVLLDPLFREQTMTVWDACTNPSLRASFWSATIGSSIEDLVKSTLSTRETALDITTPAPLIRLVIGLKDTSLPNINHKLIYAASEPGKLLGLRQLLHPSSTYSSASKSKSSDTASPALRPPFLVFTQTIARAIALHSELRYDIPLPAGGSSRIAVLHSDLSDTARADIMARFRKAQIWVLITTDLLSRGIDFRGVNGVVNYDIPTTSAGYVHRAGRTGRAGREGGVVVTFYTKEDIPYVKNVANVIAASEKLRNSTNNTTTAKKDGAATEGGIQKWLLDALPDVSKKDRQRLKQRGVEARRSVKSANLKDADDKTKREIRRARISTKSGFERRLERNRKGAVQASKKRKEVADDDDGEGEWTGFGE